MKLRAFFKSMRVYVYFANFVVYFSVNMFTFRILKWFKALKIKPDLYQTPIISLCSKIKLLNA